MTIHPLNAPTPGVPFFSWWENVRTVVGSLKWVDMLLRCVYFECRSSHDATEWDTVNSSLTETMVLTPNMNLSSLLSLSSSSLAHQAQCSGRIPRECDSRPSAGSIPGDQHRPHQLFPRQAFQHLAGGGHQAECQCCHGVRVPLQDVRRHDGLLWQDQRGEHQEQLCAHLRAVGW